MFAVSAGEARMEANIETRDRRDSTLAFDAAIERLRARLRGAVLLPGADGYEAARRVWKRLGRQATGRYPALHDDG